jgi:hypothetical protein
MSQPIPSRVMPPTTIVQQSSNGWPGATMLAKRPPRIIGKMGRIQAGVMLWIVRRLTGAEKRWKYWRTAEMRARAM